MFRDILSRATVCCVYAVLGFAPPSVFASSLAARPIATPAPVSAPAGSALQQALFYRQAINPIGNCNAVAFWLKGDLLPGAITIYVMASGGQAGSLLAVPGCGHDPEPLWPAWISKSISTNFSGWKRELITLDSFQYRAPPGSISETPPGFLSADTFGVASANKDGAIYLDDLVWANVDGSGNAVGDSAIIDDFSTGDISAWRVKGPPEAVQNLVPGVTAQSNFVKDTKVALKLDYSNWTKRRALLSRILQRALTISKTTYLVSVPSSPFERILPDSLPCATEIRSRVALTECDEQTEAGSFALYSKTGLTNVTVHLVSNLNGNGKFIPKSYINVSVVKVWNRDGNCVLIDPDDSGPTPELLVKDDRVPLACVDGEAPDVRLSGDPTTDIPANTEKQFWIDVTVPKNTPPGQYTAQMIVRSTQTPPFPVTVETDILPIRLLSPSKQYVLGYRGKLGDTSSPACLPGDHVTPVQLTSELADVASHGIHYVTLSDAPDALPAAMSTESQFNFQTPIVYPVQSGVGGLTAAETVSKLSPNADDCYYLVPDTPSIASDVAKLKASGLQTAAIIQNEGDFNQVENNLDVAIYPVDDSYVQSLLQDGGKRTSMIRDWLTWPAAQADPQVDRLYCGYLLWRSNLYGDYISDYQTSYADNPYDDTVAPTLPGCCSLRPAMLTYPTKSGVIDTIQWESIREGINDVRYLTTYYTAMRECKDAKVDIPIVNQSIIDVNNFLNQDFWLMSDVDYQKGRAMIARYAVNLRLAVDGYNKRQSPGVQQSSIIVERKRRLG